MLGVGGGVDQHRPSLVDALRRCCVGGQRLRRQVLVAGDRVVGIGRRALGLGGVLSPCRAGGRIRGRTLSARRAGDALASASISTQPNPARSSCRRSFDRVTFISFSKAGIAMQSTKVPACRAWRSGNVMRKSRCPRKVARKAYSTLPVFLKAAYGPMLLTQSSAYHMPSPGQVRCFSNPGSAAVYGIDASIIEVEVDFSGVVMEKEQFSTVGPARRRGARVPRIASVQRSRTPASTFPPPASPSTWRPPT